MMHRRNPKLDKFSDATYVILKVPLVSSSIYLSIIDFFILANKL